LEARRTVNLWRSLVIGASIGALLGFFNSYGYAISGYTTSELTPIIAGVLTYLIHVVAVRRYSVYDLVVSLAFAVGLDVTTTLTSGMLITYTLLAERADPLTLNLATWAYGSLRPELVAFYLFACAISAGGVLIAQALSDHFIEEERLVFPIGGASWRVIGTAKHLRRGYVAAALVFGFIAQLATFYGELSVDITPSLYLLVPGAAFSLALNPAVFLLALLLPINSSLGVGLGSLLTFLLITPVLTYLGLLVPLPTMSSYDIAMAASSSIASALIGYLMLVATYYLVRYHRVFARSFSLLREIREFRRSFTLGIILISLPIVPATMVYKDPIRLALLAPALLVLYVIITVVTCRVAGEVGIVSQSTLPAITGLMFAAGIRGATPYILLDPYTGTPMPQFIAASFMNLAKLSKYAGVRSGFIGVAMMLGLLLGAPITLLYGGLLLSAYGTNSPKLPLIRWLPVITWMKAIYSGNILALPLEPLVIGAILAITVLAVVELTGFRGLSIYAILVGLTITTDIGLHFIVASLIKYLALRIGPDVYERVVAYSSIALAGSTIAVALYTLLGLLGV
jgi:hypothetical protein